MNMELAKVDFDIDPSYAQMDTFESELVHNVWRDKYQWKDESFAGMADRVAWAINGHEADKQFVAEAKSAILDRLWMPAGRILAGAGTSKRVTLLNCFVNAKLEDDMRSISDGLVNTMLTQQMGGGIGTDFSPIRPVNSILRRTGSTASGPGPFIDTYDSAGTTVRSAGDRRGAQMGTMICTHPDLLNFIKAKQEKGRWTNFNVSVLITDDFMGALAEDDEWLLYHEAEPAYERPQDLVDRDFWFDDDNPVTQYVYSVHRARDLWDEIIKATYVYAEPGVIFIDRVNAMNNLAYCEDIHCTNPCVTGDTMVLTDKGHQPIQELIGKKVNVWNGEEWSEVEPFSTGQNALMEIQFSNGQTIRCTPYHKWVLHDGTRVEAKDLKLTDKLMYAEMPTLLEGAGCPVDAYSQGFYTGDGTKDSFRSNLYKHNDAIKDRLIGKFWREDRSTWVHGLGMLSKQFVPINQYAEYCVNWLAGLLDADGCVSKKHSGNVLEISAKDREFLQNVGLMLTRLGVNYRMWEGKDSGFKKGSNGKIYWCDSTARLMISWKGAHQLVQLGMKCERVDLKPFQKAPKGIARVGHRVIGIKLVEDDEETFCLTEPKRNMFIANGVLTSNCGEQPLPPHGCCDLGAAVLSRMVKHPFTEDAEFDWDLLKDIVTIGVRFLDNVIDVTDYPLPQQRKEEMDKRRIGIGISSLADAMHMLGMRYGSPKSCQFTEKVMREVAFAAYRASVQLAKEKGSFPLFNAEELLKRPFIQQLPQDIQDDIRAGFLRNGVLLTIAPTGTTSIAYGNGSSGLEPVFAHSMGRKVRQNDNSWLSYTEIAYGAKLYLTLNPEKQLEDLPAYMNVCDEVKIYEHVRIQEVCQKWVDASISKTINVPEDIDFEAFKEVYQLAYDSGLKGCTTYRPSEVRGSILTTTADPQEAGVSAAVLPGATGVLERPETVISQTIKIRWQGLTSALFLTVGFVDGKPYEVFLNSKDQKALEWTMALTILMSQGLRAGIPIEKMCDEFQQIAALEGGWGDGIVPGKQQYWPSLIAYIGFKIRQLLNTSYEVENSIGNAVPFVPPSDADSQFRATEVSSLTQAGAKCPQCNQYSVINLSGCDTCSNCGYSKCG